MNTLRPWLDVATPRDDIADGSFDESLFAADLGLVAEGLGPKDYLDPFAFCDKTYLTTNLRAVLVELGRRLAGDAAAAGVFRLQTEFGGGKTHTLLAAFHMFGAPSTVAGTEVGRQLASLLGGSIPQAKVVVLDGSALKVSPITTEDGCELSTLLGHLAYRLGGRQAWTRVADDDRTMAGSSTVELQALLAAHGPCLVLLDETLEYLNKALTVEAHDGNLAAVTLTFIKELATAVANTPGSALLATLTSSRMEDYADVAGQEMQERLSRVVGRTENVVTPVEGDDIFPILHRRLFQATGATEDRQAVADAYCDWYRSLGDAIPASYAEHGYRDRMAQAYPFHPELVDILTNRWGSLSGFQRTRGALRTLAHCVKALAQSRSRAALIHPGDVPLGDAGVRGEILKFAGESYKAALNADVIRSDSKAPAEDDRRGGQVKDIALAPAEDDRRGGQVKDIALARSLATTAFLNSFGPDKVLGASAAQLVLGVGRPGLSRGLLEDVRDSLEGQLWYMRLEGGRYRFTTEPNLNKVVLEREAAIEDRRIDGALRDAIKGVTPEAGGFRVVPWVRESGDIPDDPRLTLGVLDFDCRINGETTASTLDQAKAILEQRGSSYRSNRNALVLVIADSYALSKSRQTARTLLALREVEADQVRLKRFNAEQREQLTKRLAATADRFPHQVVMTYRHLALLGETGGGLVLDRVDLGPAAANATITDQVVSYLKNADRLISELAPATILSTRFGLLPEGTDVIELETLAGWFTQLVRVPKLESRDVLRRALAAGATQRVFGLISGASPDAPDAVVRFGGRLDPAEIQFQPGTWLVRGTYAMERLRSVQTTSVPTASSAEVDPQGPTATDLHGAQPAAADPALRGDRISSVVIEIRDVAGDKVRSVLKTAILPLAATGSDVSVTMVIRAAGPASGIPPEVIELTVIEGLRQVGLSPTVAVREND